MNSYHIAISVLVLLFSACGTPGATVEPWENVAEQLVSPELVHQAADQLRASNEASVSGASWYDLCSRKGCDETVVDYSRAFREVALTSEALRQATALAPSERQALGIDASRLAALRTRVKTLKMELDWMTPEEELGAGHQDRARQGRELARTQIESMSASRKTLAQR